MTDHEQRAREAAAGAAARESGLSEPARDFLRVSILDWLGYPGNYARHPEKLSAGERAYLSDKAQRMISTLGVPTKAAARVLSMGRARQQRPRPRPPRSPATDRPAA